MRLHVITFGICVSYLTLVIFARDMARDWCAAYAAVTFVLAAIAVIAEARGD